MVRAAKAENLGPLRNMDWLMRKLTGHCVERLRLFRQKLERPQSSQWLLSGPIKRRIAPLLWDWTWPNDKNRKSKEVPAMADIKNVVQSTAVIFFFHQ